MATQTTREESSSGAAVLYMALELSSTKWQVLFATGVSGKQRERSVAAGDVAGLLTEIALAKVKLGLAADGGVVACYEAGRDGFWLDRALRLHGVDNQVVDSASIEVSRRHRRTKTDRVDLKKLMALLLRFCLGERSALKVVRVPGEADEDMRQLSRAIERLKGERMRHIARITSLLATQGLKLTQVGGPRWGERVAALRTFNGKPLGPHLRQDLLDEGEQLALARHLLAARQAERDALVAKAETATAAKARDLMRLGAIARESSFVFATEVFGWRRFANRRELAGSIGITGSPYRSGSLDHEQGISKAGNKRMRKMLVEIAHCWLRYQPQSTLARWWQARFAGGGVRRRKQGIVALARKLLIALWRYLEDGVMPEGARLKTAVAA